ncbi:MAG: FAD-binding oxidoreductase [Bdellovibrionota bacterium]
MSSARATRQMKVLQIKDLTPKVRELILKCVEPQSFEFKAGQFVMLHVPQPEGKPALRAYSIASTDQRKDGFHLLFKFVETGKASEFVWSLKGNETLQFTGPFGKVFFHEPPTEQIIFLNTGTGLSQHLCYLQSKKNQYPNLKYRMLFGVRNEQEIYAKEELEAVKKELSDFQYEYVLSRPSENWKGKKGYVQNFLKEFEYKNTPTTFYLCGNGGMIKEVKNQLIEIDGLEKSQIWSEAFD